MAFAQHHIAASRRQQQQQQQKQQQQSANVEASTSTTRTYPHYDSMSPFDDTILGSAAAAAASSSVASSSYRSLQSSSSTATLHALQFTSAPSNHAPPQPSSHSHQQQQQADWSIVFPGRPKAQRNPSASPSDQVAETPSSSSSTTLPPSHDGTGTFVASYSSPFNDSSHAGIATTTTSTSSHREALDFSLLDGDHSSDSSNSPTTLLDPLAYSRGRTSWSSSNSQLGSEVSSSTDRNSLLISPNTLAALDADTDSALAETISDPEWSWQDEEDDGTEDRDEDQDHDEAHAEFTLPLTATPRSRHPAIIYESDSEPEDQVAISQKPSSSRPSPSRDSLYDYKFEDALDANPYALSAGLAARRRHRRPSQRALQHLDDNVSSSQISAGFKRRHGKRHDDAESVRSNKSRRSESNAPSVSLWIGGPHGAARNRDMSSKVSNSSSRLTSSRRTFPQHRTGRITGPPSPTMLSVPPNPQSATTKRDRLSRLFGRIFDVDDDVYDAMAHDSGPLAVTAEEIHRHSQRQARVSFGLESDQIELGDSMESPRHRRFRELIDGRIVADIEEEDDDGETDADRLEALDEQRIEAEIGLGLSPSFNPIAALARRSNQLEAEIDGADPASDVTPSADLTASSAALDSSVHLPISSQQTLHYAFPVPSTAPPSVSPATLLPAPLTSSAILHSTAEALHGVMPYFVPFSWRLLCRLVREWSEAQEADLQGRGQTDKMEPSETDSMTTSVATRSAASPSTSAGRGRSTERKVIRSSSRESQSSQEGDSGSDEPLDSTWSLPSRSLLS